MVGRPEVPKQQEEINFKWQTFFFFFHLLYTILKDASFNSVLRTPGSALANQCIFLMEMFFLSYVNETMYLLWNLPFFKMVPPKTNIFSFLKPWADNGSTNQYSCQLLHGQQMTQLLPAYLKNSCCGREAWWNLLSLEDVCLIWLTAFSQP